MVKRRGSLSPRKLAAQFVTGQLPIEIGQMMTDDSAGWEAITEAVRRSYPESLTISQRGAIEERIQAALPDDLHQVLCDYSDARGTEEMIATDAAFLIGIEVGRRLGGAR